MHPAGGLSFSLGGNPTGPGLCEGRPGGRVLADRGTGAGVTGERGALAGQYQENGKKSGRAPGMMTPPVEIKSVSGWGL